MCSLIEVHLQWTKVDAHSVASDTHSKKCRTSTAAQPILPSRNSLLYQINISKTSVRHQHKRGTSASYQLSIRRTSEEHQNIREISEKHQRNISQSGCVQVDIRYASVNHQLRSQRQTINCA